jgi:predicted XRE-type DNA-binding protein
MPTSVLPDILTDILEQEPIASEKIDYLEARAKLRLHNFILRQFAIAEDARLLDQAQIARRLGQTRSRISQLMGVPGNWTIESVTKLAAAIGGEIDFRWLPFPEPQTSDTSEETAVAMNNQIAKKQEPMVLEPPVGSGHTPPPQRDQPQARPPR